MQIRDMASVEWQADDGGSETKPMTSHVVWVRVHSRTLVDSEEAPRRWYLVLSGYGYLTTGRAVIQVSPGVYLEVPAGTPVTAAPRLPPPLVMLRAYADDGPLLPVPPAPAGAADPGPPRPLEAPRRSWWRKFWARIQ